MAAEKRFEWIMQIILSGDGDGPFGIVEDYVCMEKRISKTWGGSLAHSSVVQTRKCSTALRYG